MSWWIYIAAFGGTFLSVFLKGFQHKNVIANLYVPTFFTSYAMAFVDVLLIGLIASPGGALPSRPERVQRVPWWLR